MVRTRVRVHHASLEVHQRKRPPQGQSLREAFQDFFTVFARVRLHVLCRYPAGYLWLEAGGRADEPHCGSRYRQQNGHDISPSGRRFVLRDGAWTNFDPEGGGQQAYRREP